MNRLLSVMAFAFFLAACAPTPPPETRGEGARPLGHVLHCAEHPESIFCE